MHDGAGLALNGDERAELERLRGEVEALRAARPRRRVSWKSAVAGTLIVAGSALAPVSLATVWVHNQVADTDRFVATVSPVIREPAVRAALTDRVTDTVFTYVDVRALAADGVDALAAQGLPPRVADRLRDLAGPLASSVRGFVHTKVGELFASPEFAQAWDRMVRVAHEQANAVLSGSASAVAVQGSDVVLDLAPFIDAAKQQLAESGLTVVARLPEVHPTIAVAEAKDLVRAQTAYSALDRLAAWLPSLNLVVLALGVYLARDHRRALLATGLGVAASMVVLAGALVVLRAVLVDSVPSRSAPATAATFDLVVRFLRDGLRTVLVLGVVVAVGAFLAGPAATAVRVRAAAAGSMAWLRQRGTRAGLRTGRVGGWVHTHAGALRFTAVGLAVLVFVFLDRPSGFAVLTIALLLLACLAVVQFLDQGPVRGARAGGRR